jgi:hypothetical protein
MRARAPRERTSGMVASDGHTLKEAQLRECRPIPQGTGSLRPEDLEAPRGRLDAAGRVDLIDDPHPARARRESRTNEALRS